MKKLNMKKIYFTLIILMVSMTHAKVQSKNQLVVENPYIYAPVAGFAATGGYGLFKNTTGKEIRVAIEKAEGFKAVELHESFEKEGRMAMQRIDDIKIASQKTFELKPGGYHLMLFEADEKIIKVGAKVKVTFKVNDKLETMDFLVKERMAKTDDSKKSKHSHH